MFFGIDDEHGDPEGLLMTDCSGVMLARHAMPQGLEDARLCFSSFGLLVLSGDGTILSVYLTSGAQHSIQLRSQPDPYLASAISSWQGLGTVVSGALRTFHVIDLLAGRLTSGPIVLCRQTLCGKEAQVMACAQGRRSLALSMGTDSSVKQVAVISISRGNLLFTVKGAAPCWDVLGNYLAVVQPPIKSQHRDTVSVHDGLSGACLASFSMLVGSLHWLPTGTALICETISESISEAGHPGHSPGPGTRASVRLSFV